MLDKVKFSQTLIGLGEMFDKQITEFVIDTYYEIFKDYSENHFNKAVMLCLRTHKYSTLPKPADILQYLEGTRDDKALMAWLKVKEALDKGDYYQTIEFDDPIISHCINALANGWMEFSELTMLKKDMPFIEKRFMDLYRLFMNRDIKEPQKLVGFAETKNRELGHTEHIPKPIQIGQDEQLKLPKGK